MEGEGIKKVLELLNSLEETEVLNETKNFLRKFQLKGFNEE